MSAADITEDMSTSSERPEQETLAREWDARAAEETARPPLETPSTTSEPLGRYEAQAVAVGFGSLGRWMARQSDRNGFAGTLLVATLILGPPLVLIVVLGEVAGSTGVWVGLELFALAALAWGAMMLLRARAANAEPWVISRWTRATWGLAFWALLAAVRLLTHAY